jgi:hypothetical protein
MSKLTDVMENSILEKIFSISSHESLSVIVPSVLTHNKKTFKRQDDILPPGC